MSAYWCAVMILMALWLRAERNAYLYWQNCEYAIGVLKQVEASADERETKMRALAQMLTDLNAQIDRLGKMVP